jgi:hypothetical protein
MLVNEKKHVIVIYARYTIAVKDHTVTQKMIQRVSDEEKQEDRDREGDTTRLRVRLVEEMNKAMKALPESKRLQETTDYVLFNDECVMLVASSGLDEHERIALDDDCAIYGVDGGGNNDEKQETNNTGEDREHVHQQANEWKCDGNRAGAAEGWSTVEVYGRQI